MALGTTIYMYFAASVSLVWQRSRQTRLGRASGNSADARAALEGTLSAYQEARG